MILIVGLGNPDKKYEKTRHNIGFMIVDALLGTYNMEHATLRVVTQRVKTFKKLSAEITEIKMENEKIIIAKPLTYMNSSGIAVKSLVKRYKLSPYGGSPAGRQTKNYKLKTDNIWIIHDDVDLPLGKIKVSFNRGSAGHKGVQSIIDSLGRKDFYRFRIGICPEEKPKEVEKFVLKKFTSEESKIVEETIKKTAELIQTAIKGFTPA